MAPAPGLVRATDGAVVSLGGGGGVLELETVTLRCEFELLPAASRATAVTVWLPFETPVDDQLTEYGADVSSLPTFEPSTLNCTPTTATLSVAFAAMPTEPDTVAPAPGLVRATDGAVVSPGGGGGALELETVTLRCEFELLPAASRATAVTVWLPFETPVDDQLTEYGADVSSLPTFEPSTLNCTPTTATLSVAFAAMPTEPDTVAPAPGLVRATEGAVVSLGGGGGGGGGGGSHSTR